jgi:chitosanase
VRLPLRRASMSMNIRPPLLALALLGAGLAFPAAARAFVCPAAPDAAVDALDADQKRRLMELTSVFENGDPRFQYDYIENLKDGRGYTAGRVGFCTGTHDLAQVARLYARYKPDNVLKKYLPRLEELDRGPSDSVEGLEGFEAAWKLAAADPEMICAQDRVVDRLYYRPALERAEALGVKMPFGKAILYDTAVMHGDGGDGDGLPALIRATLARTQGRAPRDGYDERAWLTEFLIVRKADLLNPDNPATKDEWSQNAERADILQRMLFSGTYDALAAPMSVANSYYTGSLP